MELRDQNGLTEQEAIAAFRRGNYPHPYLTADLVLFSQASDRVLLVRRNGHPFLGRWAIPGGFVNPDESTLDAALRELAEETGVAQPDASAIREIGLFSKPGRDPRGWIVSDAFVSCVDERVTSVHAGDDASDALWFSIEPAADGMLHLRHKELFLTADDLAFDHAEILRRALLIKSEREERTCIASQPKQN